jgi:hypothetical protein
LDKVAPVSRPVQWVGSINSHAILVGLSSPLCAGLGFRYTQGPRKSGRERRSGGEISYKWNAFIVTLAAARIEFLAWGYQCGEARGCCTVAPALRAGPGRATRYCEGGNARRGCPQCGDAGEVRH